MKKEVMEAWVADLRAHPDLQGHHALCEHKNNQPSKYCCLGRLCLVLRFAFEWDSVQEKFVVTGSKEAGTLPKNVMDIAGLHSKNGEFVVPTEDVPALQPKIGAESIWEELEGDTYTFRLCLADLNDSGRSFSEIADIIEKYWDRL